MSRLVCAVGALVAFTITLSGCGETPTTLAPAPKIPTIGGFYNDPSGFDPTKGSWGGLYVISDRQADELSQKLHIVGSDDGFVFWNVEGEWTDKAAGKLVAYFSHKDKGTSDQSGVLSSDGIYWVSVLTGGTSKKPWSPLKKPSFTLKPQILSEPKVVGGLYVDPEIHHHDELFVGARMIAANYFPNITIIGTEDGDTFWSVVGHWDATPGQFRANFKAIGGMDNTTGKLDDGAILWSDGRYYRKQSPAADTVTVTV